MAKWAQPWPQGVGRALHVMLHVGRKEHAHQALGQIQLLLLAEVSPGNELPHLELPFLVGGGFLGRSEGGIERDVLHAFHDGRIQGGESGGRVAGHEQLERNGDVPRCAIDLPHGEVVGVGGHGLDAIRQNDLGPAVRFVADTHGQSLRAGQVIGVPGGIGFPRRDGQYGQQSTQGRKRLFHHAQKQTLSAVGVSRGLAMIQTHIWMMARPSSCRNA